MHRTQIEGDPANATQPGWGIRAHLDTMPAAWDGRLAFVISQVASPPMQALTGLLLVGWQLRSGSAWAWLGVLLFLAVLAPLFYVLLAIRLGQVSDLDLQSREQRTLPMLVTIGSLFLGGLVVWVAGAPPLIVLLALACGLEMVALFLITRRWKISMHSAAAAGVAVLAWRLLGTTAWPFGLMVIAVAWSRVRLQRHTVPQTILGAMVSALIFALVLSSGGW